MNAHLLHRLVEEVFLLWVRAGLDDRLEVVEECEDVRAVEVGERQVLRLGIEFQSVCIELLV